MIVHVVFVFLAMFCLSACVDQPPAPIIYGGETNLETTREADISPPRHDTRIIEYDEESITIRNIDNIPQEKKTSGILEEQEMEPVEDNDDVITVSPALQNNGKTIYHEVLEGENLQSIARDYEQNEDEIARLNDLTYPYEIEEGQVIKVNVSTELLNKKNSAHTFNFIRPVEGEITTHFGDETKAGRSKGIVIAASEDSIVKSIGDGSVIYSGFNKQFGNLIIVKLNTDYQGDSLYAAYSNLRDLILKTGEEVPKGKIIGYVGHSNSKISGLHFAMRKGKIAVDPTKYVPLN